MAVPVTAMNEYTGVPPGKNKVWPRFSNTPMQPKAEAKGVQMLAYKYLRLRILVPDACHHSASGSFGDNIQNLFHLLLKSVTA